MRRVLFILISFVFIFLINIFLYLLNDDYRFFVKKIKYSDETIYVKNNLNISDKTINPEDNAFSGNEINVIDKTDSIDDEGSISFGQDVLTTKENINEVKELENDETKGDIEKSEDDIKKEEELELTVVGVYVVDKLKDFNIKKSEVNSSLFDLTNEFPDNYIEYDSEDLVLYYFPNKSYSGVLNVFEVISYELPFIINKTNTFFGESFYVNIKKDFTDSYIRLVFNYKNNIFGLKINKDKYNEVKDILNEF